MDIDRQIFRVGWSQCRHRTGESLRKRERATRTGGRGSAGWYYRCAAQSNKLIEWISYRIVCGARRSTVWSNSNDEENATAAGSRGTA